MESLGINSEYLIVQLALCGIGPLLGLIALIALRRTANLTGTGRILWALVIIAVPILGSLAFFMVMPGKSTRPEN